MAIPVSVTLAAFCGLLLVGLAVRVSMLRFRNKIAFGDGGNPALMRSIRVHANTAEHAPIFILLALIQELVNGPTVFLVGSAAVFVLARVIFTAGLLGRGLHKLRMLGALLTYLAQAALAAALLVTTARLL